jgi:CheY-like chemotaxis protein
MMDRQVGHMVRLIDDLLDVSRITSGKIRLQRQLLPLTDLVHSAVDANRAFITSNDARLTVSLPDAACVLDVDPTRFIQVLSNLLHNAAKFTPGGHIRLTAEVDDTRDGAHGQVILTVEDTGAGIPPDLLPRVFDLFTQADAPAATRHGGLGIGLALARRLVDLHGGTITAESGGPGRGSRFTIRMPLASPIAARPAASPARSAERITKRVVIIDDNEDSAASLAMLVEELGGSVRTASDGARGLETVAEFQPDVVLLDVGMPGMDGYETCRRLRKQSSTGQLFVVAITGWGQEQDKQRAFEAGFDAHLTKPPDPAVLERLLATVRA